MRHWLFIICLSAFCLGNNAVIFAQAPSTQGKDFWLTFLNNYGSICELKLIVAGQRTCTGRVTNPNTGWATTFNVRPGVVTNVTIPAAQAYTDYAGTFSLGLHVTTTDTVSLYASNYYPASFDVANVLPTSALRDEYIVQTYFNMGAPSEFVIVATQDNTFVEIDPTSTPLDRSNASPYVITLNKGQTYQTGGLENVGLAGTRIRARDCKPIAVFAGNSVTNVPEDICCGDHLVEQLMPVSFHGRKFVVTPSAMRDEDRVLITASENNCTVKINGTLITTLSAGQTYEYTLRSSTGAIFVETSQPSQVFLYFTGALMQISSIGDPSMVLISPIEQQMSKVTFGTFTTDYTTNHYVNVVTTTSDVSGMMLDGVSVASYFQPVAGNNTYSYARIPISYGSHTLENTRGGFVAHVYGLGEYESYSYSVGSNAVDLGLQLYVNNTPVDALSVPVESCIGRNVSMRAASDYSISSVRWYYGDASSGQGLSTSHTYSVSGAYNIRAILTISEARCNVTRYDTLQASIKILPNSSGTTSRALCDGQTFHWNNNDYESTGVYTKTIRAANGCDSTDRLRLISNPTYNNTISRSATYRDLPYTFSGMTFNASIDTTIHKTSVHGCDSIVHFTLTIDLNNSATIDTSVCENSLPISWRGYNFTTAGSRSFIIPNSMGGDSVVTLRLNVKRNSNTTRHDTIVENNLPHSFSGLVFRHSQHDTLLRRTNAAGCDSLITYSLHVWPNTYRTFDTLLCEGMLPYEWHGLRFNGTSTQTITIRNAHNADSIITLNLTIKRNSSNTRRDTVRENQLPVQFAGLTFRNPLSDTIIRRINVAGCDSIIHYSLYIYNNASTTLDSTICENALPLTWNGHRFTNEGNASLTLTGSHGEDSTVYMRLHVLRNSRYTRHDTVVENSLPVRFADLTFSRQQHDTLLRRTNTAGCDSLITYSLHVWRNASASVDSTLCENSLPLTWNGSTFNNSGNHTVTLRTTHGADSVLTMRCKVLRNSTYTRRDTVVQNALPVTFAGITFNTEQSDTILRRTNRAGCDSLITYSLYVHDNVGSTADSTICENSLPLTWNGHRFNNQGTASVTLTGSHGEDSIVTMRLHVLRNTYHTRHDTTVQNNLPMRFAGLTFTTSHADTILRRTNADGCDSLITFSLHVWMNVSASADSTICENLLPLRWNNISFANEATRQTTLHTTHGADSLLTMRLHVLRNSTYTQQDTVVENSLPIRFAGLVFNDEQTDTLLLRTNAAGCDSLIHFSLYVYWNQTTRLDSTICENSLPLIWNGLPFNSDATQQVTLRGSHGDDSLVIMRLHVLRNTYHTRHDTTVQNNLPIRFAGLTFTTSHADTILRRTNAAGCDSLITYSLHVWMNVSATADSTICENQLPLRWNNISFSNETARQTTLRTTHGADSLLTMRLHVLRNTYYTQHDTVVENSLPVHFANLDFTTTQSDTILKRTNAVGCDSLITYSLFVYWNRTTTLDSSLCENYLPITWNGRTFTTDDTQQVMFTGSHGEDSLVVMHLHVLRNTYYIRHDTTVQNDLPTRFAGLTFTMPHADTILLRVNADGCDSLITYSLHVWMNVSATADSTICENQLPLTWNGILFADEGTQNTTLRTTHGADSLLTMNLHVLRNTYYTQHDTVVENSLPVHFAGLVFNDRQTDTLLLRTNAVGCDSLITYSLHVYWNLTTTLDSSLCENYLPITWNGRTFTTDATQHVTLRGMHGEDSLVVMRLHVLRNTYYTQHDTTVENLLPHSFADLQFNASHADTLLLRVNANGCDSLITYSLHVWMNVSATADSTICENQLPLTWNRHTFSDEGTYLATLTTTEGADSMLTMRLHVLRNTYYTQHDTVVENSLPVRFAGLVFTDRQTDTLLLRTNIVGCDSLISYSLHVFWNLTTTLDSSLCENYLPITWNGRTFTTDDTQQVMFTGSHGEDSLVVMRLHVLRNTYYTLHDTTVENLLPHSFADLQFSASQPDTLLLRVNANGCDSLIKFSLHVWMNVSATADSTICENQLPLTWNGVLFADEGTQNTTLLTTHDADSLLTMNLHVLRNSRYEQHDTVVENTLPLRFANLTFRISQRDTLIIRTNAVGCDSLITYSLHVYWNRHTHFDTSVCANFVPLVWRDSMFTTTATKSSTIPASTGADSTISLSLTVYPTYDTNIDASICYADSYLVGRKEFRLAGFYDVSLVSNHSCDSIVHLLLTVYETFYYTEYDTICDNKSQFFDGEYFNKAGTYVINHHTTDGCDSVMTLHLATLTSYNDTDYIIICHNEQYRWIDSIEYSEPTDKPRVYLTAINNCDSIRTLNLQVDQPVIADYNLSPDIVTTEGQEVFLNDRSINTIDRQWFIAGHLYGTMPQFSFPYPSDIDTLRITLAVQSALGCTDTAHFIVPYDAIRLWIPTVFTPELPSNNQFYIVSQAVATFECSIYNRQGLLVFKTNDPSFRWNGTHSGSACPQGSYVYTIRYTTQAQPLNKHTVTGTVLLLR